MLIHFASPAVIALYSLRGSPSRMKVNQATTPLHLIRIVIVALLNEEMNRGLFYASRSPNS